MIKSSTHAIILAGGLGTRLRSVVSDLPKCMAPVNGKPFLYYVIHHLKSQGINNFVFSVGYKHEAIIEYIESLVSKANSFSYKFSIEEEPLGTGGAIKMACRLSDSKSTIVCNGDTLFSADLNQVMEFHETVSAACTLTLKYMVDFDRYGVVELNEDRSVKKFSEKQWYKKGLINGGMYILEPVSFLAENLPEKFSFEKDYLEKYYDKRKIFGITDTGYFIDIGIPSDYSKAQIDLN